MHAASMTHLVLRCDRLGLGVSRGCWYLVVVAVAALCLARHAAARKRLLPTTRAHSRRAASARQHQDQASRPHRRRTNPPGTPADTQTTCAAQSCHADRSHPELAQAIHAHRQASAQLSAAKCFACCSCHAPLATSSHSSCSSMSHVSIVLVAA